MVPEMASFDRDVYNSKSMYFPAHFALLVLGTATLALWLLYRRALPKPIPGIPYSPSSARRLLGDVPAMKMHISQTDGTFITYIMEMMKSLDAPLVQVFIRPLSKPLLVLADFREAHDILVHRKDFDRSNTLGDLVKGLAPDHHIHLKTNGAWKAQRRLVQDLMTPSFLHHVVGPVIHQNASTLIDLWRVKSRIAGKRPWYAAEDVNHVALDAVMAFAFGQNFDHSMTRPTITAIESWRSKDALKGSQGQDDPVLFPKGPVDDVIQATLDLTAVVGEVQGNPLPDLTWAYVMRRPRIKRATKLKETYIKKELEHAVERLGGDREGVIKSAVDHLVVRENNLAEKDKRNPDYYSRIMIDEVSSISTPARNYKLTRPCRYSASSSPAMRRQAQLFAGHSNT